jgi:16S rRNA (cytosine967-C5)-methyltransferase
MHTKKHALEILEQAEEMPLDLAMSRYFRARKFLGVRDRRAIGEGVYGMVRWRGLLDHQLPVPSWASRWELFQKIDPLKETNFPDHVRCSFPKDIYDLLGKHYGEKVFELCMALNGRAPTTVRVNTLKVSREELLKRWKELPCRATALSDVGVQFEGRVQLMGTPEARGGMFELQDEASQLVAALVAAKPGDQVLDYCAGSGGKALAIATRMHNRGQLFLHDVRERILLQARKRMKLAGVQNAQIGTGKRKSMDWVLVDAPCSGSGAWRRNPEMKWRFELDGLKEYVRLQREIFAKALTYMKPGGRIVYATCSLFPEENQRQMEHFVKQHGLQVVGEPFHSLPREGEMDGFFGVVFCAGS